MTNLTIDNKLIKRVLTNAKTIAMVGVSLIKKEETSTLIRRRPSIIVMKYLQEFGYRVVPVNPSAAGKQIHQEIVESENITYIANRCIKQEYQKLFLRMSPVFPVLQ